MDAPYHGSYITGVWVVGGHFNNTCWCQTCKKHFYGIFIWFPRIVWPRSGYIIYFEGGYEDRMFGDRATKRPKYCHFICPFVVPSNIVLVATWLLLYGRPINSLSSQIVLEVDEVCQQF